MDYYEYHEEIINNNKVEDFYGKTNFVGYILPDGSIYSCQNHNMETLETFYDMMIFYLKNDYKNKEKFLGRETKDPIFMMFRDFFWNATLEEIIKFDNFIKEKSLTLSDVLVSFFGCHLVTRLDKRILTSSVLHYPFFNYILMGFKVDTVPRIVYQNGQYSFNDGSLYNDDFLIDEIEEINDIVNDDEKPLFFR